jgi:hypothetical protein
MILQAYPNNMLEDGFGTFLKVEAMLVTGHGGTFGCETGRLPHFL